MRFEIRDDFERRVLDRAVRTYLRKNYLYESPEYTFSWRIDLIWFNEEEDGIFTIESTKLERDRCGTILHHRIDVVRTINRDLPVEVIRCETW